MWAYSMSNGVDELVKDYEKLIDRLKIVKTKSTVSLHSVDEAIKAAEKIYFKTSEFLSELGEEQFREKPISTLLEYMLVVQIPYIMKLLIELKTNMAKAGEIVIVSRIEELVKRFDDLRSLS